MFRERAGGASDVALPDARYHALRRERSRFHLENVALLLANAVLLFLLLRARTGTLWRCALVAVRSHGWFGPASVLAAALALAVLVLYAPVLTHDFVDFDNDNMVTDHFSGHQEEASLLRSRSPRRRAVS